MNNKIQWMTNPIWKQNYINTIQQCLDSQEKFNMFRALPEYCCIISDCMPYSEAEMLFGELIQYPEIMNKFSTIKLMDNIGSPELYEPWNTSPRNLKYMYAAARIIKGFGKEIKNIVEIGVGYGGLCFTLGQYLNLTGYKLVDIDCVVKLTKLFLSKLPPLSNDPQFFDSQPPYDLCISECALSELSWNSIEQYYNDYLLQSQRLFIRTNFQQPGLLKSFINFVETDFNVEMEPDLPNEENKTVLFGWKK